MTLDEYHLKQIEFNFKCLSEESGVDGFRVRIAPRDVPKIREYFEGKDCYAEILVESTADYGMALGPGTFKHYAIIRKR